MPNLSKRSYEAELIDDFELSNEALRQNLKELAFINKWLGGNAITTNGLSKLLNKEANNPLTIVDLGCGGGDMLQLMSKWAKKQNLKAKFIGIDANQFMIDYGKSICNNNLNIYFEKGDVFSDSFKNQTYDVATMTLFCHHFTENQLVELFTTLNRNARIGLVINDLHRHWLAYYSISWLTGLFSKSYLVKNDARLSVWRGFKKAEFRQILLAAGFKNFTIRWKWAFRWKIVAFKN